MYVCIVCALEIPAFRARLSYDTSLENCCINTYAASTNLCAFLTLAVDKGLSGRYFPQNRERVCTTDLARWIAEGMGKKLLISRAAGLMTRGLMLGSKTARKAFCSLSYEGTETLDYCYCIEDSRESVLRSVDKRR